MQSAAPMNSETQRLCQSDNWDTVLDDPTPRAVRWASRTLARNFNDPDWGKWHYTEGNGLFTACAEPVRAFLVDGSPESGALRKITCRRCMSIINLRGAHLRDANGMLV